jgi:hypothetical protein
MSYIHSTYQCHTYIHSTYQCHTYIHSTYQCHTYIVHTNVIHTKYIPMSYIQSTYQCHTYIVHTNVFVVACVYIDGKQGNKEEEFSELVHTVFSTVLNIDIYIYIYKQHPRHWCVSTTIVLLLYFINIYIIIF